ncbi:TetR/AcrR family transcriptional regulator [Streptomyces sp. NPDC102441]|uniref:TetR/AcrR family transcriptional regulator n=1 Tax=Streptomyces sp. NPDC102441 TaxID=3366176 RepID=UPI00382FAB81
MPDQTSHKPSVDGLRADARENRDRILRAARDAFGVQGIDVPVAAIARRAGVGVATLYRRFPTRASLVTEAFAEELRHCVSVLDDGLADPDPWRGFCTVIEKVCLMQAADRGFTQAFLTEFPGQAEFALERARAEENLALLVQRAKDAGGLREDFEPSDVTLLLLANCGVTVGSGEEAATASRRLAAYLLQAFRAETATALPAPARLDLRRIGEQ